MANTLDNKLQKKNKDISLTSRFLYVRKGIYNFIYINIDAPLHRYICNKFFSILTLMFFYYNILTVTSSYNLSYPLLLTVTSSYSLFSTQSMTVLDTVYIKVLGYKPKSYWRYIIYHNVPKTNASLY